MQDALLRAWRAIARFEGRSSLRTWLYTIATNVCLKAIERRPKLVLPVDYGPPTDPHEGAAPPLVESVWIEPYPDERLGLAEALAGPEARYEQRESVELAFIAALQLLPARQRAVLILRDVLGFSGEEVARGARDDPGRGLQRAAACPQERRRAAARAQPAGHAARAGRRRAARDRRRLRRGVGARRCRRGRRDARAGGDHRDAADADLVPGARRGGGLPAPLAAAPGLRWRVVPARASGQLAFGFYRWSDEARTFAAHDIIVLTMDGARIAELVAFLEPAGLPALRPARRMGGAGVAPWETTGRTGSNRPAQKCSKILFIG